MSDEKKSEKRKKNGGEKNLGEPVPADQDFFNWLESLFYATPEVLHYPEKIDVRLVSGKHFEKMGPYIKQIIFAPAKAGDEAIKAGAGRPKPTREELVAMSNELLFRMQKDCDEGRKPQTYGIHAWHYGRGDEPYDRWIIHRKPKGRYSKDDRFEGEDEDGQSLHEKHYAQMLEHHQRMFALYGGGFEGLLDRMDRILERQDARIEKQDAMLQAQQETVQRALSLEAQRKQDERWMDMKIEGVKRGMDLAQAMIPPIVNQLAGKAVVPSKETAESVVIKTFLKSVDEGGKLTEEQSRAAFGVYDDKPPHSLLKPGVLTRDQVELLLQISECKQPADALDEFMPGGRCEISFEQLAGLQQIFSLEQLMPLQVVFQTRYQRAQEKAAQGSPSTP